MKKMKLDKDNDFDFTIYKEDQEDTSLTPDKKKPKITTFRSKFSPGEDELANLSILKMKISECGIKVAANANDINQLWKLYSCINNYWARVKPIFGQHIEDTVEEKDKEVKDLLVEYSSKSHLDYDNIHVVLLEYRDIVFKYSQNINLGIEVEKTASSKFKSAETKMVQ